MLIRALIVGVGAVAALGNGAWAHAEPPRFPDLSRYAPVNPTDYIITLDTPGISSYGTYFRTPDGIACTIAPGAEATCAGRNIPGVPPAAPTEGGTPRVNSIGTGTPMHPSGGSLGTSDTIRDQPIKVLPPFHSISLNGVVCGVNDSGMTACKDPQGSGFILSPSWSGWLPHA